MNKILILLLSVLSFSVLAETYYDSGLEAIKKGKYEKAVKELRKSKEKDVMKGIVTEAQVNIKLREAESAFLKEKTGEALKYEKEKKLKKALSAVKDARELVPGDKRANQMFGDYEKRISDLEAQVKSGKELLDKKDYVSAYSFFKKLMPYEDTLSSISSGYDSAISGIVRTYKNEAEVAEKNGDFSTSLKAYKSALAYRAEDRGLKSEIERMQKRIEAKSLFQRSMEVKGKGNEEAAFNILLDAYSKDRDNKEIKDALTLMKNDMAGRWADRAGNLEDKDQLKEAYILVEKAISVEPDDKSVKERLNTMKKKLSVKLADQYRQKADHLTSDLELSYLYLMAATNLDSNLKDPKKRMEEIRTDLERKTCYKLGYNIEIQKGLLVPAGDQIKETIKQELEKELGSFNKRRCITLNNDAKGNDGSFTVKVLAYNFTEQQQNQAHKVKYSDTYQKNSSYDYEKVLSELKVKTGAISQNDEEYKNYAYALLKNVAARDEIKYVEEDVKRYKEKEYETKKELAKNNNEKFGLNKDAIPTPYDSRLSELKDTLKTSKESLKQAWDSIPDKLKKDIKDQQKEIEKTSDRLSGMEKFRLTPVEKWTEYNDVTTKLSGKLELELIVKDNVMNKQLADVKRMETFSDESRNTSSLVLYTEAGKQEISREIRGKKLPAVEELKKSLLDKVVGDVSDGMEKSNLRYHGDRFYQLFSLAKDRGAKTRNALLTIVSDRNLSDAKRFMDEANMFIKKEYGVDIRREKVEISQAAKL